MVWCGRPFCPWVAWYAAADGKQRCGWAHILDALAPLTPSSAQAAPQDPADDSNEEDVGKVRFSQSSHINLPFSVAHGSHLFASRGMTSLLNDHQCMSGMGLTPVMAETVAPITQAVDASYS